MHGSRITTDLHIRTRDSWITSLIKADVVRMYLPPDANCFTSCFDQLYQEQELCQRYRSFQNTQAASGYLWNRLLALYTGYRYLDWASNDCGEEPDVVMACCGDTPTLETMAAVTILRDEMPELKIRVVNVVDLFKMESDHKHPHGLE